ncbi:MAG: hypothetical protein HYR96_07880 [Deltaproteobacteria bacterium]|nr:hypothetical protein [Deltaproteobacteria bacterium]MBI3294487.1 hypothetical protein [Deltaproteobacteria bacterium]
MVRSLLVLSAFFSLLGFAENSANTTDDSDSLKQHLQRTILDRISAGEALDAPQRIEATLKLILDLRAGKRFSETALQQATEGFAGRLQELNASLAILEIAACGIEVMSRSDRSLVQSLELSSNTLKSAGDFRLILSNDSKFTLAGGATEEGTAVLKARILQEEKGYRLIIVGHELVNNQQWVEVIAEATAATLNNLTLTAYGTEKMYRISCQPR